ncbi:MAG TPA: outer membrane protein assembly factor BamD [Desulfatiglandales bacterium]|nr:outer membrane protein assembly factor BamD [Desulfatiglandales bacterium]
MKRSSYKIICFIAGVFLLSLIGGCAERQKVGINQMGPEEFLARGLKRLEHNEYKLAIDAFQAIKDRYPYSKTVITAELKMAESYILSKDYESALEVYDDFERLHPKDSNIPFVIYQRGLCNLEQAKTIDRDQTYTVKARVEFERLVKRFPKSELANKARANVRKCTTYLAEHELYVGHFYYKIGEYASALGRYTYLIKHYPDMGQYHEALEYISRCKEKLAETEY